MGLILFLIFTLGLKYLDPPEEYGIAVNFGTSDVGSGNSQSEPAPSSSTPQEQVEEVVEEVQEIEEIPTEPVSQPTKAEDVITTDNAETVRINKEKEAKRKAEEAQKRVEEAKLKAEREAKQRAERLRQQKAAEEARKRQEEAEKKRKLDALMGGLNKGDSKGTGTGGTGSGGDGNDNKAGDKGNPNGDPNASGYYGNGGGGSGGNYRLGNRRATSTPKPTYDCNEQGKVVVSISVDKNGKVLSAKGGIKGTTNTAPCLIKRAEEAALKTKFNADGNAPSKQVGSIIYNFTLAN